ncbi:MAG: DUF3352 domain-containing protein [Thermomicrobiales bacterium]
MPESLGRVSGKIHGVSTALASAWRIGAAAALILGGGLAQIPFAGSASAQILEFTTAKLAPADSLAYVVMSLDERSQQWQLADTLLDRAGLGPTIDQMIAQELNSDSGDQLPLDAFMGGEVAVVASTTLAESAAAESMGTADIDAMLAEMGMATPEAESSEPKPQGFAIILDSRAPDTAWSAIRDSIRENGSQEVAYDEATILYAPGSSPNDEGTAATRIGDEILIAMTPADLYPVIDTAAGTSPSLADLAQFSDAQAALPGDYLLFGFINGASVDSADLGSLETAVGQFDTKTYSATAISADEPGFRLETVALPADGATLPAATPAYDSALVAKAPADALAFMSAANLGATGALDALGAVALSFAFAFGAGGAEPTADQSAEDAIAAQYESAAQMLGVNLQTDLFHQLEGEYGFWLKAKSGESGSVDGVSGLFASGVADAATVKDALTQLSLLAQGASDGESPITTRKVGDDQLFVLDLGSGPDSALEIGVLGDQLVVGDAQSVDSLHNGGGESLSDNTQFQAVMDTLPAEHNGMIYLDLTQVLPLLQAAEADSSGFGSSDFGNIEDASPSCERYKTQADAQAAYDAAEPDTFDLDQDFDGQVCEDFFATSEDASADTASDSSSSDPLATIDYSAVKAFASVSYRGDDGLPRTSAILYIAQ